MSQVSFFALYSDGSKYQVIYDGSTWLRDTNGQKMPVPWRVGAGQFVGYGSDYCAPPGLRGCDWIENARRLNAHLTLFTAPHRPATEPIPQTLDTKVHLEERLPGESRLAQLQRSVGRQELQARTNRQREFQKQASQAQPTARQIAAAAEVRRLNNFHARQIRPRNGGGGFGEGFVVKE
jgi:hypothetical protein